LEYRAEQLGDLVSQLFETYLPWVTGIVVTWANDMRLQRGQDLLPGDLPALIRWGVDRVECVSLMIRGIRSRRLCHAIVSAWSRSQSEESVLNWIRQFGIEEWRQLFQASPFELANLVSVVGPRRGGLAPRVLAGERGEVILEVPSEEFRTGRARILEPPGTLEALRILVDDRLVGSVSTTDYAEVANLLATGLGLDAFVENREGQAVLSLTLAAPED
jgi:hypothetical protein